MPERFVVGERVRPIVGAWTGHRATVVEAKPWRAPSIRVSYALNFDEAVDGRSPQGRYYYEAHELERCL